MRKPVVLITGAGGEIGHGLVTRLAAAGSPIVTLDVSPARRVARAAGGARVHRVDHRRQRCSIACWRSSRSSASFISRRCCRRASEFTPVTAHHVNVEGTLNLLEFAQHEGESHGRPVCFIYPSSIAAYGLPSLEAKTARRRGHRGSVRAADDDVRVQQAVLRAARALLRAALQAAVGRRDRARRFPVRPVSRA